MAALRGRIQDAGMRNQSGLVRFGIFGLALGAGAVTGSLLVPGEIGALLRGYGAMLIPAALYLFAGLAIRGFVGRNQPHLAATPHRPTGSAGDTSSFRL